ncbi:MAG: FMN-binding negative transcriptional regulator [Acidobacteria bacterium]|nr:FMN-binding negative transcriptional regulator [Acidobacteriota bacterium]
METIYIPERHQERDLEVILSFMEEFSFATVVTASPGLWASHIPLLLDRSVKPYGLILGHLAKGNPQLATFDGEQQTLILFRGPHAYISPAWYATEQAVPTWNFAAVHATGRARTVSDPERFEAFLTALTARHESYEGTNWTMDGLTPTYKQNMLRGAQLFEMPIENLEAKFKTGAERSAEDRAGMLAALAGSKRERTMAEFMELCYRRYGKL